MFPVHDVLHDFIGGDDDAHRRACARHSRACTSEQTFQTFLPAAHTVGQFEFVCAVILQELKLKIYRVVIQR
jgi:hypothetical protein